MQPIGLTAASVAAATGSPISPPRDDVYHHPTPGLESLLGAYRGNIARLERSAEELSSSGSDLGEEIRKVHEREKRRESSRRSSLQSLQENSNSNSQDGETEVGAVHTETGTRPIRIGSRVSRKSSYTESVGHARCGGFSPGRFSLTSPVGSTNSGSGYFLRTASGPSSSRLVQTFATMEEGEPAEFAPPRKSSSVRSQDRYRARRTSQASQSSLARSYDMIAAQAAGEQRESTSSLPARPGQSPDNSHVHLDPAPIQDQPPRPRSTDTYLEAQTAFIDFDGVHFSPETEEYIELDAAGNELRRVSARSPSGSLMDAASLLRRTPASRPISYALPPPPENMVYYPAPVPRMLNLPKRLSQLPAANVQAMRRSQMLSQLGPEARHSAPWLSQPELPSHPEQQQQQDPQPRPFLNERMSRQSLSSRLSVQNLSALPPQVRASMFFEYPSVPQEVEVQAESAVATLESILAASATAPVNAFVDHAFAGDVRSVVYAPSAMRNVSGESGEMKKQRSSSIGNLFRRQSRDLEGEVRRAGSRGSLRGDADADQELRALRKRRSQLSLGDGLDEDGQKLQRRQSQMSLGDDLNEDGPNLDRRRSQLSLGDGMDRLPADDDDSTAHPPANLDPANVIAQDFKAASQQDLLDGGDVLYAPPTTLLAELQVRKAQQKSRNRNAPTAYPGGMHSTLLQLDAVEAVAQRKRQKKPVRLAWEDPTTTSCAQGTGGGGGAEGDEDVPLGMLYPAKPGPRGAGPLGDRGRPLGLMEKRLLEDSEPLSKRRNRLMGISPAVVAGLTAQAGQPVGLSVPLVGQTTAMPPEAAAEHAGVRQETLGQRQRRLKTRSVLDGAIADVAPERPVSTFSEDVLGQFAAPTEGAGRAPAPAEGEPEGEEETLTARRARLQREAASSTARPALQTRHSLASLLTAHPVGARPRHPSATHGREPAVGSLLHAQLMEQERKGRGWDPSYTTPISGAGAGRGLVGSGGSLPLLPTTTTNGYFASPTAVAMGNGGPQQHLLLQMQMQQQLLQMRQIALAGYGYPPQQGYAPQQHTRMASLPYSPGMTGVGGAALPVGVGEAPLETGRRDAIDRWRASVGR